MKPYELWNIEMPNTKFITTISARDYDQCRRKAWKKIAKKAPELVPYLKKNYFLCIRQAGGGWGDADFYGDR